MDEKLKSRFWSKMIKEFASNNCEPYPTIMCEMERPEIVELIRKFVMFSTQMKPFKYSCGTDGGYFKYIDDGKKNVVMGQVKEGLEITPNGEIIHYGFLYILVTSN